MSYCRAGLESEEFCLWIVAEPLTVEEATAALTVQPLAQQGIDPFAGLVEARVKELQTGSRPQPIVAFGC